MRGRTRIVGSVGRRLARRGGGVLVGLLTVGLVLGMVPQASAVVAGASVDLKVLVVAAGSRTEDVARDLMETTLTEIGVPYTVVDARRADLTAADLYVDPTHGRYNGVIVTISDLYQPGGGSGFTLAEWQLLHQYERDFGVRESVVSGYPTWDPSLDLDYGMANVSAVGSAQGRWQAPAGGTELFEYVNTANPFAVTAFAFEATPRADATAPVVTPLMTDSANGAVLVSTLRYADGREVLLSTIANAPYFVHSQVLAYEFLSFATRGLFLGTRQVHLSVHTDDLFIEDEVWDPVTNSTSLTDTYRMTPADVSAMMAAQTRFRAEHPLANDFVLQFPFNGFGAGNGKVLVGEEKYRPTTDAEIRPTSGNLGAATLATIRRTGGVEASRYLLRFEDQLPLTGTIQVAELKLRGKGGVDQQVTACLLTQDWAEGSATWAQRTAGEPWSSPGGTYDTTACLPFVLKDKGNTKVDLAPIWERWLEGQTSVGIVIRATSDSTSGVTVGTRESGDAPELKLKFAPTAVDPLTTAIVANRDRLRFVNHTYASLQMDRVCPDPDFPQPVLCPRTSYLTAYNEIARNRDVWEKLGLPKRKENERYLLSDSHAGLHDRMSTEENPDDDVPFPQGKNDNFFAAMAALKVTNVASDSSRPGQATEAFAPGFPVMVTPRYPSAIFVNSTNPAQETDQYNWIFHDRYLAAGIDPCTVPAAICQPRTWEEILAAEGDTTLIHMLSNRPWPHYMHQINLRDYDGAGNSLQFDWLNAVMSRYEQVLRLPVVTLEAYQVGALTERRIAQRGSGVRGTLDIASGKVTLVADRKLKVDVTGLKDGSVYGGQRQRSVDVSTDPKTFDIDPALTV